MRGSREISLVPSLHRASTDALIRLRNRDWKRRAHSAKPRIRRRPHAFVHSSFTDQDNKKTYLKHTQNSTTAKLPSPQSVEYL